MRQSYRYMGFGEIIFLPLKIFFDNYIMHLVWVFILFSIISINFNLLRRYFFQRIPACGWHEVCFYFYF
jgi:hypothetical protein